MSDTPFPAFDSVEDFEAKVTAGGISEGPALDAKRELPPSSDKANKSIAIDLAAMSTQGGTLIYGVGENASGEPTVLSPFQLKGARERISNLAETAVSPRIQLITRALTSDEGSGYLVVTVPRSHLAPHMVTVKGHNRFYGRNSDGNYMLSEPDVAQLYARREQAAQDSEAALGQRFPSLVRYHHSEPYVERLAVVLAPALASPRKLDAIDRDDCRQALEIALGETGRLLKPRRTSFPPPNWRPVDDGLGAGQEPYELFTSWDLNVSLVDSQSVYDYDGTRYVGLEPVVESVARTLLFAGSLLGQCGCFGPIHCGVIITGLDGANPNWPGMNARYGFPGYPSSSYARFGTYDSLALQADPLAIVRDLLHRFVITASDSHCSILDQVEIR